MGLHTQVMEGFVGSSKDSLTLKANPDLAVNAVVLEFGKFIKIIVHFSEDVRIDTGQHFNPFDNLNYNYPGLPIMYQRKE